MKTGNFFSSIPDDIPEEVFDEIARSENVKIERIISLGHASPAGFWYEQETEEWVMVLEGSAVLLFEDGETATLNSGDYLNIPARAKHRVEWTDPDRKTVWLAVHY